MPRLKTRFVVEFEYDVDPKGYDGVKDPKEMAAIDQMGAEKHPERSLKDWMNVWQDLNFVELSATRTITVKSEVVYD